MAKIVLPYQLDRGPRKIPPTSVGARLRWFIACLSNGAASLAKPASLLTLFIGGSIVAYLGVIKDLSAGWIASVVVLLLLIVVILGAEKQFFRAYRAAWEYAPTWQLIQDRADILRLLADEPEKFKNQFKWNQMVATRADYDRAEVAGFQPDFPRDEIPALDYEGCLRLISAFDDCVNAWREAERESGGIPPSDR